MVANGAQPGDEALITGELALTDDNCVGIRTYDDIVHLVVWPEGTAISNENPLAISVDSEGVLDASTPIEGSGGFYNNIDSLTDTIKDCQAPSEVVRIRFE